MADTWGITLTAASFSQGKKRLILDAIKYEGAGEWGKETRAKLC